MFSTTTSFGKSKKKVASMPSYRVAIFYLKSWLIFTQWQLNELILRQVLKIWRGCLVKLLFVDISVIGLTK